MTADRVRAVVSDLPPVYFALVMATGTLSIGFHEVGRTGVSVALLVIDVLAYAALAVLTVWRVLSFRSRVAQDARNPTRAFGFFTIVAGSNVLASRLVVAELDVVAYVLLAVGTATWLVLGYLVPWLVLVRGHGDTEASGFQRADGSWFVWAVASQSVAVAAAMLQPGAGDASHILALLAFVAWAVGCFLYAAAVVLVGLKVVLYGVTPEGFTPTYWVTMGAASITILAGVHLAAMRGATVITVMHGLTTAASVMFWAFATWLLPVLVAAGWWRHVVHRVPLAYEPALWTMVFPLAMYALASMTLGDADGLAWITRVGKAELWLAAVVWLVTFVAMCHHLYRRVVRPSA